MVTGGPMTSSSSPNQTAPRSMSTTSSSLLVSSQAGPSPRISGRSTKTSTSSFGHTAHLLHEIDQYPGDEGRCREDDQLRSSGLPVPRFSGGADENSKNCRAIRDRLDDQID